MTIKKPAARKTKKQLLEEARTRLLDDLRRAGRLKLLDGCAANLEGLLAFEYGYSVSTFSYRDLRDLLDSIEGFIKQWLSESKAADAKLTPEEFMRHVYGR